MAAQDMSTPLELSIGCLNLVKHDVMSKSDPMTIVDVRNPTTKKWEQAGRTELIKNEHNPKFATPIRVKYFFEESQEVRFTVVDVDHPNTLKIDRKDRLGKMKCTLADIVGSIGSVKRAPLQLKGSPNKALGEIEVKALEVSTDWQLQLVISGEHLDKKDFMSKSDPFLIFHRVDASGGKTPVHKTEVIKNTLDPKWKPITIPVSRLCGGNAEQPIFIECYDWDKDGSNDLIGQFTTTLNELCSKKEFELIEPHIQQKKKAKYKNSGILRIHEAKQFKMPSFIEYLMGGTEVSLIVGIDYTASNGDPSNVNSLHYRNPSGAMNEYQTAIYNVGHVVAPYDKDGWIPTFGFGGQINNQLSHCFPLSSEPQGCSGVNGVMEAYTASFNHVKLYGPTNFAPIITHVNSMAEQVRNGEKYYVLLMLTDGVITDMPATLQQIKKASNLPLSIIIIGVGAADFSNMEELDDDDNKLGLVRDLVQFVPYRKFLQQPMAALAKETLAEVPKQLVSFMTQHNIQPQPRPPPPVYAPVQAPVQQ